MKTILVVDDEEEIANLIELYLRNTYRVIKAKNGLEALERLNLYKIDLAIIDIMMPKMDGYVLIENIRKSNGVPIIIISAKNQIYDKIIGLDIGADDYVIKPFDPLELVARVKSQIRRNYKFNNINENVICIKNLSLSTENMSLKKDNEDIYLTSKEYKILELLMGNPNKVFTKKNIFESVWNEPYFSEDNAIMVHISKLRDKIEDSQNKYIKTIRGLGYKFNEK